MYTVEVAGQAAKEFECPQEALAYSSAQVYLSVLDKARALGALSAGEPFAYAYGFASVSITPKETISVLLPKAAALAAYRGLKLIASEAGPQIHTKTTPTTEHYCLWEPHKRSDHFIQMCKALKLSLDFKDECAWFREPTGEIYQEFCDSTSVFSMHYCALKVAARMADKINPPPLGQ